MSRKERALKIAEILEGLYKEPAIPLEHRNAYTLLIAVLLSAQCTDARVNLVTPHLFALASTPEEMARLTPEEIAEVIKPCGLWKRKSQAIWDLSKILVKRYGGEVPRDFSSLESLPGVGHKTASVLMIQAFDKPAFPVDTHIHRCAKRWGLSSGRSVQQTEKDLKALFPKLSWCKLHLQIIYFARQYCTARQHNPSFCPICSWAVIDG